MRVVRQGARTPEHVIAAIVDDYRAGLPTAIIAARHGVTTKTVNRHALNAGVRQVAQTAPTRPRVPCATCGNLCRPRSGGVCAACIAAEKAWCEAELTGGRWVPHRGILIWEPGEVA